MVHIASRVFLSSFPKYDVPCKNRQVGGPQMRVFILESWFSIYRIQEVKRAVIEFGAKLS